MDISEQVAYNNILNRRNRGHYRVERLDINASLEGGAETSVGRVSAGEMRPQHRAAITPELQGELSFSDVLDVVNPLQQVPVVSSIYREVTGDEISGAARAVGGLLYGGPVGMLSGAVNAALAEVTGKDVGQLAASAVLGGDDEAVLAEVPETIEEVAVIEDEDIAAPAAPAATPVENIGRDEGIVELSEAQFMSLLTPEREQVANSPIIGDGGGDVNGDEVDIAAEMMRALDMYQGDF